jgi:hypothetical protein
VAGDIEVELSAGDLTQICSSEQDLLTIACRSGQRLAERADDAAAARARNVPGQVS